MFESRRLKYMAAITVLAVCLGLMAQSAFGEGIPAFEQDVLKQFGPSGLALYRSLDGNPPLSELTPRGDLTQTMQAEIFNWLKAAAQQLNNRAIELYGNKHTLEAIPFAEQGNIITLKAIGPRHAAYQKSSNFLLELFILAKRYPEAERLARGLISQAEAQSGPNDLSVAALLNKLANIYSQTNRRSEIEPLYKRCLEINRKAYGETHPSVVTAVKNLALLYDNLGRLADAEPLYKEDIRLSEAVYGPSHPSVASGLNNLGLLYYSSGRYNQVEELYKRALKIYEASYGAKHPAVSTLLNNLAVFYTSTGRFSDAETYYIRAVEIDEGIYGKDHTNVMSNLNNLANLYKDMQQYDKAEPLYKRALEIGDKALSGNDPALAANCNNLGMVYYLTGRLAEAEPLYRRALDIGIKALGEQHPDVAGWKNNLALLYASQGKAMESFRLFRETMDIEHAKREDVFTFLPEDQKLAYMRRTEGSITTFISLTARMLSNSPEAVTAALDAWLKWKGAVMDDQLRYMQAGMQSENADVRERFTELTGVMKRLAKLKLAGPSGMQADEYQGMIDQLDKRKGNLEAELSRLSREFAINKTSDEASVASISALLPPGSAYLDYAYIETYDFSKQKAGRPAYFVFVLLPGKHPIVKLIELDIPEKINVRVNGYLSEIRSPVLFGEIPRQHILNEDASRLYAFLIKPVEQHIKDRAHLFISPGGSLNLVPFEVFVSPSGKYLIEDFMISYITAGRDIMRFQGSTTPNPTALIMSDPDYDYNPLAQEDNLNLHRHENAMSFARLPETRNEADAIAGILTDHYKYKVENLKGAEALDEVLFKAESPRVLHLATHAYFLQASKNESAGKKSEEKSGSGNNDQNPMLRSGIVLAGANPSMLYNREFGIVSAYKAMALRLNGTELVVLSACDTGTGEVQRGEGVFGLRRAFIVAGAKSLVMSLWSVPSSETTKLMTSFYRLSAEGNGKAKALRKAKLELINDHPNPFYWGAFVLAGNPD